MKLYSSICKWCDRIFLLREDMCAAECGQFCNADCKAAWDAQDIDELEYRCRAAGFCAPAELGIPNTPPPAPKDWSPPL